MIHKIPSSQPGFVCVAFELPSCIWADRIVVSGTFNDWSEREMLMHQDHDGVWRARLELPSGQRYEYRYLVDGRWQSDSHGDGFAENSFGLYNSVVDLTLVMTLPTTTCKPPPSFRLPRTADVDTSLCETVLLWVHRFPARLNIRDRSSANAIYALFGEA